jgi:hypothetical protein
MPGAKIFDAIVFGYYDGGNMMCAGRTRSEFTPASRGQLFKRFKPLAAETCPFANLPEAKSAGGAWGLTAEKMKDCRWVNPWAFGDQPPGRPPQRAPMSPQAVGHSCRTAEVVK